MQIEQHHVAAARVEPGERVVGIGDGVRIEIHVRDHFAERLANQAVVVDDQHARTRTARLGARRHVRRLPGGDRRDRNRDGERRALTHLARHLDGAAEQLDEPLHDRQPHPRAFEAARARRVQLGELLEDQRNLRMRHARPRIADDEHQQRRPLPQLHAHGAGLGITDRVGDEVVDDLANPVRIGIDQAAHPARLAFEPQTACGGRHRVFVDDRRQQLARLEMFVTQLQFTGAEARIVGQVLHLRFQMPRRGVEPLDHLAVRLGVIVEAQQFDRRHDGMQRRAQFVTDHAEKRVLGVTGLARRAARLVLGFERRVLLTHQARAAPPVQYKQQRRRRRQQQQQQTAGEQHAALVDEIAVHRFAVGNIGETAAQREIVDLVPVLAQLRDDPVGLAAILRQRVDFRFDAAEQLVERMDFVQLPLQQRKLRGQTARRARHHVEFRLQQLVTQHQPLIVVVAARLIQQQLILETRVRDLQLRGVPVEAVVGTGQLLGGARVEQIRVQQVADRAGRRRERGQPDQHVEDTAPRTAPYLTMRALICHTNFESPEAPASSSGNASRG